MTTKPEDALVERVAEAINAARSRRANPDRPDSDAEYATKLARAALEASGITTLLERERRKDELLDCARDEYEQRCGRIVDDSDPHWSVQARAALTGMDK